MPQQQAATWNLTYCHQCGQPTTGALCMDCEAHK